MKKNYIAPVTMTVDVKTEALLGSNSTGYLRNAEASSTSVGLSREGGSSWDDED